MNFIRFLLIYSIKETLYCVLHKHCDCHRAYATWNWSDERGDLLGGVVVDITNQSLAGLLGGILNEVGADVDDNGAWLDPLALDEVCLANGRDKNISVLDVILYVLGVAVADGDGAVGLVEEVGDWGADNVTSSKDDSVLASEVNTSGLEELHDTLWSARGEQWLSTTLGKLANVGGTEAINILFVGDSGRDVVLGHVLWHWKLDQDTVDGWVVVLLLNCLDECELGGLLWELDELAADASLLGGLQLHLDIGGGVGAVAHCSDVSLVLQCSGDN